MIQELGMQKPEMIATRQPNSQIESQLQTYFIRMHDKIMNGTAIHEKTEKDTKAEIALDYASEVLTRNDRMCEMVQSPEYNKVREKESALKGTTAIGKIFCIDGRIARIHESFVINTWEKAAGLIRAERRASDDKLIPTSASFCESISSKINPGHPAYDLLEINTAHYDSTSESHGCAAINLIRRALNRKSEDYESASVEEKPIVEEDLVKKSELEEVLSEEEVNAIINSPTPEDANLLILETVNARAITNYYNSIREQKGLPTLKRVAISALYDTATMGMELRYGNSVLSTTNLTNKYMNDIDEFARTIEVQFGSESDALTKPESFLDFSLKLVVLETEMIENKNSNFDGINEEIDSYINSHLVDLTEGQMKALKFKLLRKVGFQYLTGLSKIPESGHPEHPFAHHNEAYIAISAQGQFVGKYDLVEQEFGSSSEDIETAIDETLIANLVMDKNHLKENETRIAFICTSASRSDYEAQNEGLRRARANSAELIRGIAKNEKLKQMMRDGKIIPIPVLLDEKRRVLEIPDHSAYF